MIPAMRVQPPSRDGCHLPHLHRTRAALASQSWWLRSVVTLVISFGALAAGSTIPSRPSPGGIHTVPAVSRLHSARQNTHTDGADPAREGLRKRRSADDSVGQPAIDRVTDAATAYPVVCPPITVCVDGSVAADGCKTCLPAASDKSSADGAAECSAGPEQRAEPNHLPQQYNPTQCPTCECVAIAAAAPHLDLPDGPGAGGVDSSTVSSLRPPPLIVMGLTKSISDIEPAMYTFLHRLSCANGGTILSGIEATWEVHLHLLVSPIKRQRMSDGKYYPTSEWVRKGAVGLKLCNTTVHTEDTLDPPVQLRDKSRIERIAILRDALRVAALLDTAKAGVNVMRSGGAVVVIDFDLVQPPSIASVVEAAHRVGTDGKFDLVCANGKDTNPFRFWMYDTFATILTPNTFVFPIKARRHQQLFPGEDKRFVIQTPIKNQDVWPLFTREDLTMLFDKGPAVLPVRSCFGGLAV